MKDDKIVTVEMSLKDLEKIIFACEVGTTSGNERIRMEWRRRCDMLQKQFDKITKEGD